MRQTRVVVLRSAPWIAMAAVVFLMLLKYSTKTPEQSAAIAALAVFVGFVVDRFAAQWSHILGSHWDRGS